MVLRGIEFGEQRRAGGGNEFIRHSRIMDGNTSRILTVMAVAMYCWAVDLDADDRLDLILAGREARNAVWYRNRK